MNIDIGTKIKSLRLSCKMTQEQLGSKLSVSAQAVSKWESGTTAPDIELLPEISVLFGVSIDELFSMSDENRMDRIENMIENRHFISEKDFSDAEYFLKEKISESNTKARAVLTLAQLYSKRAHEYSELASEVGKEALLLNPNEKSAHNVIFDSDGGRYIDYNASNHIETIEFYKNFIKNHPQNPRTYLWLMDLLIEDGRTAEAMEYLEKMDAIEHSFRTELYLGFIAKAECNLPDALEHWDKMTDEFNEWLAWSSKGDIFARLCRYDNAMECYKRALDMQPKPRYTDIPEAMSFIAEIQGDFENAVKYRKLAIEICKNEWNITEGETIDMQERKIANLRGKI